MAIHVGIGSWADKDYDGLLYPKKLPAAERLKTYATWFDHVEVNSSYYATPRREVVAGWAEQTPADFMFQIKLHRALSQSPKKAAAGELPKALLHAVEPLVEAKKLATFLLVLPPSFGPEKHALAELDALVEKLSPHPLAVELRDNAWVADDRRADTLNFFRERQLVWVAVDMPQIAESTIMPAVDVVTHPKIGYMRLHGRNPKWFEAEVAADRHLHDYMGKELDDIVQRGRTLEKAAKHVYVVANNHAQDFAPKAALALQKRLGLERRDAPVG